MENLKKIGELPNIGSISSFYHGMMLGYDTAYNFLFISEKTLEMQCKISQNHDHNFRIEDENIYMFNHNLYIYDNNQGDFKIYRHSLSGGSVNLFDGNIIENKYDRNSKSTQITLYEKHTQNIQWQHQYQNRRGWCNRAENLYIIDLFRTHISFVDKSNGIITRELEFISPKITGDILYFDYTLMIPLEIKPLKEYHLLGLDARTGEEKWRIEEADFMCIQDPVTGYLYDIGGKRFNVIDPCQGKIIYQGDMTSENKKYDVLPESGILGKGGIYFKDNFPCSKVGFINLSTYKIDFVQEMNFAEGVKIIKMQYHNGRLYVLDTDHTLHVFAEE